MAAPCRGVTARRRRPNPVEVRRRFDGRGATPVSRLPDRTRAHPVEPQLALPAAHAGMALHDQLETQAAARIAGGLDMGDLHAVSQIDPACRAWAGRMIQARLDDTHFDDRIHADPEVAMAYNRPGLLHCLEHSSPCRRRRTRAGRDPRAMTAPARPSRSIDRGGQWSFAGSFAGVGLVLLDAGRLRRRA